ncbi:MAG: hypothetical protein CMI00_09935 [Oceanospirillaceae bacterium]|nr:hypothetical protein [Oceanospirillaceae bacterium]|tara:strand:- start:68802 stop:69695 length:894 start_codon:yes stop_codon:yes gene_type:complete
MKPFTTFKLALLVPAALLLQACIGGGNPDPGPTDPGAQALTNPGPYEICYYDNGISSSDYASARMFYPCDLSAGPFPATTLTGGYTNTKEDMYWLAYHLTSHGYVVMAMTPTNRFGQPPVWAMAQKAGFAMLATENSDSSSPLQGMIDLDARNLMGFSMGGGGVLLAASEMGGAQTSAIALAPWLGDDMPVFGNINKPTLMLGSEEDELAYYVEDFYSRLPSSIERGLGMWAGSSHFDWYGDQRSEEGIKAQFRTLVTAFLEVHLKGDSSAYSYFEGAEHDEHVAEGWFSAYDFQKK